MKLSSAEQLEEGRLSEKKEHTQDGREQTLIDQMITFCEELTFAQ